MTTRRAALDAGGSSHTPVIRPPRPGTRDSGARRALENSPPTVLARNGADLAITDSKLTLDGTGIRVGPSAAMTAS